MAQKRGNTNPNKSRKSAERQIFDKSVPLIEKYNKNTNGLTNSYQKEAELAKQRKTGHLNWGQVYGNSQQKPGSSMGYVEAVQTIGQLLLKARDSANPADKQKIDQICKLKEKVQEQRKNELAPNLSLFGWIIWGGEKYDRHKCAVEAWNQFGQKTPKN